MFRKFFFAAICFISCSLLPAENVRLLIPETIYAVPGVETNIYFNNVVTVINPANYVFDVTCVKGRNDLKRWRYTPTAEEAGSYTWEIKVINMNGVIAQAKTTLVVLPADAGKGKKYTMLIVGASQTGAGYYPLRVAELMSRPGNPEFKLLGSRARLSGRHEGYGGWRWESFLTRYGFTGDNKMDGMHPDRPVGYNSPFIFPDENGKPRFDLKKYFDKYNGGKAPDFISFQLGINDIFSCTDANIKSVAARSLAFMEKLTGEFKKLNPKPEIMIFQHIPGASQDGFGKSYNCGQTSWQFRKNLDYYNRALLEKGKKLGLHVVPVYINLDTENNYPTDTQPVNGGNPETIVRQDNGVHPAPAGYYQMGDTVYCFLKALIHKKK